MTLEEVNRLTAKLDGCIGGGFSRDNTIFISCDDHYKMRHDVQYFYDEANHFATMRPDCGWSASNHHGGETPRGTKPNFIGGRKKSKQERVALKARRKQR